MVKLHHAAMSVAAIAAAGAFVTLPAAGAGAATTSASASVSAHPNTATKSDNRDCGDGHTHGNEWICTDVHKDSPTYVRVSDKIIHYGRTVQICMHKDNSPDKCTPFEVVEPGQTESAQYPLEGAGTYCAVVYRLDAHGKHSRVDVGQCVTAS